MLTPTVRMYFDSNLAIQYFDYRFCHAMTF